MKIGRIALSLFVLFIPVLSGQSLFAQFNPDVEHKLFDQANEERAKLGLTPFVWDERLMEAARLHARKMAEAHSLSHRLPNEDDLSTRVAATGLRFSMVAENIADATDPAEDFHYDWMHSPGHRANILDPRTDTLGVAVLKYENVFYAVEDFAKFVMEDPSEKAENRFAATFNRARTGAKQFSVQVSHDESLRKAACSMADKNVTDARAIPSREGAHGTIAFNASQPEELPQQLVALSHDPSVAKLSVGACFKATPYIPGGSYWFAIVY